MTKTILACLAMLGMAVAVPARAQPSGPGPAPDETRTQRPAEGALDDQDVRGDPGSAQRAPDGVQEEPDEDDVGEAPDTGPIVPGGRR